MQQYWRKQFFGLILGGLVSGLAAQGSSGQNFTRSPFSSFGIGELSMVNFTHASTLMSTHSGYYSYSLYNPATVGSVRYTTLDFSGMYKNGVVSSDNSSRSFVGGGLGAVSLTLPVWKYIQKKLVGFDSSTQTKKYKYIPHGAATSLVLRPLSTMGYSYYIDEPSVFPTKIARTSHSGSGGLSLLQWNTGFRIANRLNVGYGLGYVFGTTKDETYYSIVDSLNLGITADAQANVYRGFQQSAGIMYTQKIDSTYHKFGASYEWYSGANISQNRIIRFLDVNGGYTSVRDTIFNTSGVTQAFTMPSAITMGYSFQYRRAWSLGVDYRIQDWTQFRSPVHNTDFFTKRTDLGVSFILNPSDEKAPNERKMKAPIRLGYMQSNTQINYDNGTSVSNVQEQRYILGFGVPFIQRYYDNSVITNMLNVQIQYLQRGLANKTGLNEQYIVLTLGLQLGDIWFAKRKYD